MPDSQSLTILTDLRKGAGLTLSDMATRCGLHGKYGHQTAGAWERGSYAPSEKSRRKRFMGYLWDDLRLRQDPAKFEAVWQVLQDEWGWKPLQAYNWAELVPLAGKPDAPNQASNQPAEANGVSVDTSGVDIETESPHHDPSSPDPLNGQTDLGKLTALPRSKGPIFGRDALLVELLEKLAKPECRLLTLIGPGGIGKTRLCQEIAAQSVEAYTNGVCFVALAAVDDQIGLVAAIAHEIGLPVANHSADSDDLEQRLIQWFEQREMLLILDNFEQLLAATPFLTALLEDAEDTKLLVTSRIRVNLQAEWIANVSGLAQPPQAFRSSGFGLAKSEDLLEEAMHYGAVQLFVQCAQRVSPAFALTHENLSAVIHICQLVRGMPLALELASSWSRTLTSSEIAGEIESNLDFLSTTMSDVTERHRSIRAVFGYSWQQLTKPEQKALMQLSVFRSGFGKEAAADVASANLSIITSLMDKSFLRRVEEHQGQQGRYEMHELLRQLVEEQLSSEQDLETETRTAFSIWYTNFLVNATVDISGCRAGEVIRAIDEELQNIRPAWRWLVDRSLLKPLLSFTEPMCIFFYTTGRHQEGHDLLQYALDTLTSNRLAVDHADDAHKSPIPDEAYAVLKAKIRSRLASFKFSIGQRDEAQLLLTAAYSEIQAHGNPVDEGYCLTALGSFARRNGDYAQSAEQLEKAMSIYQELSYQRGIAEVLIHQGVNAYNTGHLFDAQQLYQEAFRIAQNADHAELISTSQHNLGQVCQALGEFPAAMAYLESSLHYHKMIGATQSASYVMVTLATIASQQGEFERAAALAKEAAETFRNLNYGLGLIVALRQLGDTQRLAGDYAGAAVHLYQSQKLAEEIGLQPQKALCICSQGKLKLDEGDYAKARVLGEQSHHLCKTMGIRAGTGYAQNLLGQIALAKEQYVVALGHFQSGLKIGLEMNAILLTNEALLGVGVLLAICNAPFAAAITLQMLAYLSSSTIDIREEAQRWLLELDDQLEAEESQRAKEQAQLLTIEPIYSAAAQVTIRIDNVSQLLQATSPLVHDRLSEMVHQDLRGFSDGFELSNPSENGT